MLLLHVVLMDVVHCVLWLLMDDGSGDYLATDENKTCKRLMNVVLVHKAVLNKIIVYSCNAGNGKCVFERGCRR